VQGLDVWAASALDSIYNTSGSAIVNNKTNHSYTTYYFALNFKDNGKK